jgi:hypothetical protein
MWMEPDFDTNPDGLRIVDGGQVVEQAERNNNETTQRIRMELLLNTGKYL